MAKIIETTLKVNTAQAQDNVQDLNEDLEQTSSDISGIEGAADSATGGMVSGFKAAGQSIKGVIVGFKTMRGAIIATGIGALVIGIVSLSAAFTASEEGQNKFSKLMGVIGSVTGNLIDVLANLGDKLIWVFTSPIEALNSFVELIKSQIINRFNAAIDTVGFLGSAIKKVFQGDFKGAMDDAKEAGSSYVDVLTGVEDSLEKVTTGVKGFVKEIVEEGKIAGEIADMRAKADKLERKLLVDRATADRDRADLLEKAVNREMFTTKQRIGFLEEAGRLEEEITNKEIFAAQLRLKAKIEDNKLSKSTKEDLEEEAQLKATLIQLETAKLTKAKEVTSQTIALKAEEAAALKAIKDAEKLAEKEEQKIIDEEVAAKKVIDDAVLVDEENKRLERKKAIADEEIAIEQMIFNAKKASVDGVISLFGAESKAGKAALIVKQIMAAKEMIMQAKKTLTFSTLVAAESSAALAAGTANTAKIGFPQNIPMLIAYALQAVGIISSIRSAVGTAKTAAANAGAGGGGVPIPSYQAAATPSPPSFTSVGSSGTNQLADAIGQQNQQTIQAYVVSNDITNAQSLERNIIEGAAI